MNTAMRVIGSRLFLIGCIPLAIVCQAAESAASAKLETPEPEIAAKPAAKKDSKKANRPPKSGIKTPGIQIPMADLATEAEIVLSGPVDSVLTGETLYAASKAKDLLAPVDTKTNKAGDPVTGIKSPCSTMIAAFGSVWVPNCGEQSISRLDPKTRKLETSVPVGVQELGRSIAASADSVWVLSDRKTTLSRIDPDENKIVAEIRLPEACNSILFAENALWVTCPKEDKVLRVDPRTNLVSERIQVSAQPTALAFGEASVWVFCKTEGQVSRIDPKTNKVTTAIELKTPGLDGEIAFGEGFAWVSSPGFPITRIDPASDKVLQQFVGEGGGSIYVSTGAVWLPNFKPNTLTRFDPKRIKATLPD